MSPIVFARKRHVTLQRLLVAALLLVLLPAVAVQAWFSYRTAQASAIKFQEQLAGEVSARVFDKVLQFFEVPRLVVRYNVEQFRTGVLNVARTHEMQTNFLLQLGQQPMLTFVSVGTAKGEYFAASRPPVGEERDKPRLLQAMEAEGRTMSLYRVEEGNRRGELISRGNAHFDARSRPWFKAALRRNKSGWYPVYQYRIDDSTGYYDAMGIGMSAPLFNAANEFVGVVTADVALVQLSTLLASITRELGGAAFLFDPGGDLLAASTMEPIYERTGRETVRVKAVESRSAIIRAASQVIGEGSDARGRTIRTVDGETYLLDWWQYPLPDGPTITIASVLPQSRFDAPSRSLLVNLLLFSMAILLCSVILSIFVSRWVAKPLVELGEWATRLGHGNWDEAKRRPSPITEVESLSSALHFMAGSVKYHTDNLEKEVAVRTAELEQANAELAKRSNTDGLTGVANRRYFDEVFAQEVARARRFAQPVALIMVDVDRFKSFNDRYGHLAGDRCLSQVAEILKTSVHRPGDLVARYGGEEFAIVTAHSDIRDALALAEILRRKIERLAVPHDGSSAGVVTASFGVAVLVPDEQDGGAQLIALADKALYRAKAEGRNRVERGERAEQRSADNDLFSAETPELPERPDRGR